LKLMNDEPWLLAWFQRRIDKTAHPDTLQAFRQKRRSS
jgi:hypothetical protein